MFSVEFDANIALSIWWFQAVTSLQTAMLAYSGTFLLPTSWGMPNIGRTETEAMLAGVGRNHPNDHFLQIPRVDNVARCYVCELVPGLKNAMLDFTGVYVAYIYSNYCCIFGILTAFSPGTKLVWMLLSGRQSISMDSFGSYSNCRSLPVS